MGFLQPEAEGSPTPVPETDTFERSVTSRPTISSRIKGGLKSRKTPKYRSVSESDLSKINRYGREVQGK